MFKQDPPELTFSLKIYMEFILFNVIKQDGSINSVVIDFNIYKKEMILVEESMPDKKNNRLFCSFKLAPERNTFEEVYK
jgi:hypothetical protein